MPQKAIQIITRITQYSYSALLKLESTVWRLGCILRRSGNHSQYNFHETVIWFNQKSTPEVDEHDRKVYHCFQARKQEAALRICGMWNSSSARRKFWLTIQSQSVPNISLSMRGMKCSVHNRLWFSPMVFRVRTPNEIHPLLLIQF